MVSSVLDILSIINCSTSLFSAFVMKRKNTNKFEVRELRGYVLLHHYKVGRIQNNLTPFIGNCTSQKIQYPLHEFLDLSTQGLFVQIALVNLGQNSIGSFQNDI